LISRTRLGTVVPAGYDPEAVPLYGDRDTVEDRYAAAEREGTPFFAVERHEDGFAVTYDLLPAGVELSEPACRNLDEWVTRTVETVVGDESRPTAEVSRSIGDSLGSISLFAREDSAREVAAVASRVVLDRDNWVAATPPDGPPSDVSRND
jgi:hypothetical protein